MILGSKVLPFFLGNENIFRGMFVGGHEYRVYVTVVINPHLYSATQFAVSGLGNPDVTARVNGNLASMKKSYNNDARQMFVIVYEFPAIEYEELKEVRIWQLSEPTANSTPDFDVTIGSNHCHANTNMGHKNGIAWYAPHINSLVGEGNHFEAGWNYEFQYSLEVDDGFYFAPGLKVFIDGKELSSKEFSYINQFLTITKSYACENTKIKTVAITEVEAPSWINDNPKTPDYEVSKEGNFSFVLEELEVFQDNYLYNGIKWINVDTGDALANTDEFGASTTYKVVFYLIADEYYDFAMNGGVSAVTATVNGKLAECYPIYSYGGDYAKYLAVEYTFAPTDNTIKNIYLSNFIEPENTNVPIQTTDAIATGAGYYLNDFKWRDANKDPFEGNFEFNKTYYAWFVIWAEDGYEFDTNDYHLFVNGVEVVSPEEQDKGSTHLGLYVAFICKEISLNDLYFEIVLPTTGEYADETLTPADAYQMQGFVKWYIGAEYDNGHLMTEVMQFENGLYGAEITLAAKDGYRFADDMLVHFNGNTTYMKASLGNKLAAVEYELQSEPRYTISFDANGGGAGQMENITYVKDGTVLELPDCDFTAPDDDYRFVGWSEMQNGEVVDNPYTFTYANDLTLYAVWEEWYEYDFLEIDTHLLIGQTTAYLLSDMDIASGNVNVESNYWMKGKESVAEGTDFESNTVYAYIIEVSEKGDNHFPIFSGNDIYSFVRVTGDADYYSLNVSYDKISGEIKIVLQFTNCANGIGSTQARVKFYDNKNKDQELSANPQAKGTEYTIPDLGDGVGEIDFAIPQGKYFYGWATYDGDEVDSLYYPGQVVVLNSDEELVAMFEDIPVEYTVSFNANSGTGSMNAVEQSGYYQLPANEFAAPSHKVFVGWAYTADGEAIYGDTIKLEADVTLYAVWEDIKYTVSFDANSGTATMDPVQVVEGDSYTLPQNGFTAPNNKHFVGWAYSAEGNVIAEENITVTQNVTLYAIWAGSEEPGDVVPANPNYPHTTIGGKEVYVDEIMFGTNVNVGTVFASAKAGHGVVRIDVAMMPLSLLFDENAVNAIGGKDVILNANLITSDFADLGFANIDGIQLAFELVLEGSTFEAGTVTVSANAEIEVPEGKQITVYYINGTNKTAMPTTYQNGVLSFTTNHFSNFAAVLEDKTAPVNPEQPGENPSEPSEPSEPKVDTAPENKGLSGGAIAGIVIACVIVVAGAVVLVLFLLRKKGLKNRKIDKPGKADDATVANNDPVATEVQPTAEPVQEEPKDTQVTTDEQQTTEPVREETEKGE